jgi:outer membrane receptor protein involved in Fe transport
MKIRSILVSLFLSILSSGLAVQAMASSSQYLDFSLEQLMQVRVTGATLKDESLKTVPAAATIFTRDQLDRMGMDYLFELLNLVPGYQFNRNGDSPSGYTFSARGRRISAEAREVLLLVDGRVYSDPRTGGADGSFPLFPLDQIERVEIIRGPGSALYGSNAFNGVINIVTRRGVNALTVAGGSLKRRRAQLHFARDYKGWESNVFARFYEDQGQRYLVNGEPTTDPRQSVDLDFNLGTDATQFSAAYHRVRSEDFLIGETLNNGVNNYQQLFKQLSFEQELKLIDNVNTRVGLSHVNIEQDFGLLALPAGYLTDLSEPMSDDPLRAQAILAGETYRLTVANDWTINTLSSAQFGMDWHENTETKARAKNNFDLAQLAQGDFPVNYYGDLTHETIVGGELSQTAMGLYGQYLRELNENTHLTLGVRYDNYSDIGNHVSPRLGLVRQITDHQTFKILYGEAYRAPSLSEMGLKNNPTLVGNPNLNYEIVKTWDLIWLGSWHSTSVSINGFRNDYTHPIATGLNETGRTYVNGADEYSTGLEMEVSQQVSEHWLLRATYTHFLDLPDSAFREADYLASLMLNYDTDKWTWNIAAVRHGERNELVSSEIQRALDAYWFANTKYQYRFNKSYEIGLQIKNIFDEHFYTPSQGTGVPNGIPHRGREMEASLRWNF